MLEGRKREREGGREGGREGEREGGRREGGREGGEERGSKGIEGVDVYVSMSLGVFICICLPTP